MSKTNKTSRSLSKIRPLRLDQEASRALRQKILERDGWRCQACGSMQNLQVHHQRFRSHSGGDREDNLITLCGSCHEGIHSPTPWQKRPRATGSRRTSVVYK